MGIQNLINEIPGLHSFRHYGRVTKVTGLMIESIGPRASIGELCTIEANSGQRKVMAEVVGFRDERVLLMPYDSVNDLAPGSLVSSTRSPLKIQVGTSLVGEVIDGLGRPLQPEKAYKGLTPVQADGSPPNPLERPRIKDPLSIGVKAIDAFLPVGRGQRLGIFAGSGVGKSTMMAMIAKHSEADVIVIGLIGERGREVKDFLERDLGPDGRKKSIVVAATSDQPALMRIKGAMTATAVAEYFRDLGMNVLLMMDSVTRFAMAQREIGLAIGEPPTTKGYTPSVFASLPRLLERSGTNRFGSITAFYTVLVDGDDLNDPVADAVRGILDGHLVLDRKLANKGQFPAVNLLKSVSRVMKDISTEEHQQAADSARNLLSVYSESEDLINIGAYKRGSSTEVDRAIAMMPELISFIKQGNSGGVSRNESVEKLITLMQKG
ncbi:flagellar protein export ATPase FliI [Alteribacter natronophilus]|uniref:flagellar protein export ATPase FliI n=1 Tax=Alteribacter natronophilus TaxID=2583810 RepID=UPI00110DA719|nr:flagellar protein export ATPase FliI [Alteribacter natronophilus]TMW73214.1 flagellar protein export ATPase FliI [Alteribacter natronophilus]